MHVFYAHSIDGAHTSGEWTPQDIITKLHERGHTVSTEEYYTALDPTMSAKDIYESDQNCIQNSDLLLINVTNPSLGVGYEIGYAEALGKPIVCFYQAAIVTKISPMITGNTHFTTHGITHLEELHTFLQQIVLSQ